MKRLYYLLLIPLLLSAWRLPAQLQVSFDPGAATLAVGEEKVFNLVVNNNFDNLVAIEFTIAFDQSKLEFVDAWPLVDTNSVNNFKGISVEFIPPGNPNLGTGVKVFYYDFDLNPKSLPDNTPFIAVKLRGKAPGTSQMLVQCDPFSNYNCEILNQQFNDIGITGSQANITVVGTFNGITATIGEDVGSPGEIVCLPVTVDNFNDVSLMEFGVTWDPAVLEFSSLANCNSTLQLDCSLPLPNGNFGFFNANTLQLSWINPFGGDDLEDGAVLFELCFKVIGTQGQTSAVSFFKNPIPSNPPKIEFRNSNDDLIQTQLNNGSITVGNSVSVTIDIAEKNVCQGDTFCVPVTATNFNNIVGVQLYFKANPIKLDLVSVKNCNPELNLPNCSLGNLTFNESSDILGFLFEANPLDPDGVTLDSGAVLFELCYQNLMLEGQKDTIRVVDKDPLMSEVNDTSGVIGLIRRIGQITTTPCNCDLNVTASIVTKVNCPGGSDGAINLLVTGGSGDLTFTWSPTLPNTKNPKDLPVGTYKVTITDNIIANCQWISGDILVGLKAPQMVIEDVAILHETCSGSKDGSIELEISGGTPNFIVNWGVGVGVGNPITGLAGGTYTATITDNNGCSLVGPALKVNSSSLVPVITSTNVTCFGLKNGTITLTLPSGGEPYTVTWNPSSAGTGKNLINLGPGEYIPTIEDVSGCITNLEPIVITEPPAIDLSAKTTPVLCAGLPQGSVNLTAGGGTGTITYLWSNGAVTEDLINVVSGNYSVTATDANGCTKTGTYSVSAPANPLTLSATTTSTVVNQSTGTITLTVTGGTPDYTYQWSNGPVTKDQSGLAVGSYTVTVTDANGCTKTLTSTVTAADDNLITFEKVDYDGFNISCFEECDGTVVAFPPGSALLPVTYKWSTSAGGGNMALANKLCAGNHSITITDANGKVFTGMVTITAPPAWTIDIITDGQPPFASAFADVNGIGSPPYTYLWNNGEEELFIGSLEEGKYCVTVTNARGCQKSACVDIYDVECLMARNVITPNNDGKNDFFVINCVMDDRYKNHNLHIFNRWGQSVYSTSNYVNEWQGQSQNGTELSEGAYFYVFEWVDTDGTITVVKGDITLLR